MLTLRSPASSHSGAEPTMRRRSWFHQISLKPLHANASAAGLIAMAMLAETSLAQTMQVSSPASPAFQPGPNFDELRAEDVDTWGGGGVRSWYPWQTPRGLLEMRPEPFFDSLSVMLRSDIGTTALLAPATWQGTGFSFTQFFAGGDPVNAVSCRLGAQADSQGGPFIDSVITATFDDGYAYSFPVSEAGLTYVGFSRPDGPVIHSVTFTASVGVTAINTFGIGTVPSPAGAGLLGLGGLLMVSRRRR